MTGLPVLDELLLGVTAATNATPIQITTDANHLLTTGDTVTVFGVGGNSNANGKDLVVTVVDATNFTIDDSAGNANYFPLNSGKVRIDKRDQDWDGATAQIGSVRTPSASILSGDYQMALFVHANSDPSGGGVAGVRVKLWGSSEGTVWFELHEIDNTDAWVQDPDSSRWVSAITGLQSAWPFLRLSVEAFATSTNTVKAYLVA